MSHTVSQESFASLTSYWENSESLKWGSVFVLPAWLEVWWQIFQPSSELDLRAVRQDSQVIGIAPLQIKKGKAFFIGSADVCDYLDFVITPGREKEFFPVLLGDLRKRGINSLELSPVRPDSTVFTVLLDMAKDLGGEVSYQQEAVSLELDLPPTWEEYLGLLTKKQRHEVRRKLRRLAAEKANYRWLSAHQDVSSLMDTFLTLFSLSSKEVKVNFMTAQKESFFRSLAEAMAKLGLLRFGILEVYDQLVAMMMAFDYHDVIYLYNSACDPKYDDLSVGLLSKVLGIKESIQGGKKKWDFLKGAERYKYDIGGKEIPIYNCRIVMK